MLNPSAPSWQRRTPQRSSLCEHSSTGPPHNPRPTTARPHGASEHRAAVHGAEGHALCLVQAQCSSQERRPRSCLCSRAQGPAGCKKTSRRLPRTRTCARCRVVAEPAVLNRCMAKADRQGKGCTPICSRQSRHISGRRIITIGLADGCPDPRPTIARAHARGLRALAPARRICPKEESAERRGRVQPDSDHLGGGCRVQRLLVRHAKGRVHGGTGLLALLPPGVHQRVADEGARHMPHLYRESTVVLEAHPRVARICLQRASAQERRDRVRCVSTLLCGYS